MAGTQETLALGIDVATEVMASKIAIGTKALDVLEQAGVSAAERIEAATARAAVKFGPFAQAADNAVSNVRNSFKAAVSEVEKVATALANSANKGLGVDLGAEQAREAATAARQRVAAIGQVEAAVRRQAASETQLTATTKFYLAAVEEAKIKAAAYASQLEAEAGALERLQIDLRQAGVAQGQFNQQQARTTVRAGQTRAGMQQLSYQLNDVAVGFAAGTPPMIIFAQQSGQVIQALQLMSGNAKGFIGFLGGPWGMAITSALIVLTPFVAKLFDTSEAAKKAEEAAKSLADRQLDIANFFDRSTGKIRENSRALIENAKAQIYARTLQAENEQSGRQREIAKVVLESRKRQIIGFEETIEPSTGNVIRSPIYSKPNSELIEAINGSKNDPDKLARELARLANSSSPAAGDARRVSDLIAESALAGRDTSKREAMLRSLETGELDPSLLETSSRGRDRSGKTRTGADDRSADELARLRLQLIDEEASYTGNLTQRRDAELAAIDEELASYERNLAARSDITATRKAQLLAAKQALSGQQRENAEQEYGRATATHRAEIEKSTLQVQISDARLRAQLAGTSSARLRAELDILDLSDRLRKAELDRIMAVEATGSATWQAAKDESDWLDRSRGTRVQVVKESNLSPMDGYAKHLRDAVGGVDELNESFERVEANGLQSLEDGLVGIITGTESVAGAFKRMAASILADLARIAAQKFIFSLLGFSDGGLATTAAARKGYATGGLISGPGTGTSDSILARLSDGEFVVNAEATRRFLPVLQAINDNQLPKFASGGLVSPRLPSIAPDWRSRGGEGGGVSVTIHAPGATAETVAMIRREIANAAPALVSAASANTTRQLSRRKLA
ncbi:MAG: phage tail length tape measure family protein [Burkholderiaceae bacterium]